MAKKQSGPKDTQRARPLKVIGLLARYFLLEFSASAELRY
ncbi:MAG: hypothetical protein RL355_1005 [Actinomycetota bacterium]|jgi:hypothetical protein